MVWICNWAFCQRWIRRRLDCSLPASVLYKTSPVRKSRRNVFQKVLHHLDFDPDDVDHDMHERLMAAIEEGDLEDKLKSLI